jgi:transporter family protein
MLGELSALASALTIAASAVIARSLAAFISARPFQTMRAFFGALFLIILLPLIGRAGEIFEVRPALFGFLAGSALLGTALGDTLYVRTLGMVEASRTFPTVRGAQILSTIIVALLFFEERVTWATGVGAVMILGGVYFAAFANTSPARQEQRKAPPVTKWIFPALIAGLCWTGSLASMKIVLAEVDAMTAQTIKLPVAVLILTMMTFQAGERNQLRLRSYKKKTLFLLILCGILSYGTGVVFELYAISYAGLAKAAILTSWAPLFILFLSALFLKERITLRLIVGTLLCSGGTLILMVF